MEYWEFLLQQEGDSNWLPLDTSQMEILEGRYRIMAHCSQAQASVDISVSHRLAEQVPPKRRSLKRQGQTNENGLMVVLPFTRLSAGTWDIHCQSSAKTQAAVNAWHYAIQLRVLSQDAGEDGDWFADDGSSQTFTAGSSPSPEASPTLHPDPEAAPTPILSSRLDLQQVAAVMDQTQARLVDPNDDIDFLYTLHMPQTALMAVQGQPIQLTGQATGVVDGESCSDMALVVRLLDPQNAETLTLSPFGLSATALPSPFFITLPLPQTLSTRLLLGELALLSWQAGTANMLTMRRFTVTVDLTALFDEIANQAETEADPELVFAPDKLPDDKTASSASATPPDDDADRWAKVDFPVAPPRAVPTLTLPRSSTTIPPKIYYPSPHETSARTPALPPLGKAKPAPLASLQEPQPEAAASQSAAASPTGVPVETAPEANSSLHPAAKPSQELSLPPLQPPGINSPAGGAGAAGNLTPDQGLDHLANDNSPAASEPPEALLLPSHETMAFKALHLQDRFWHRLNELAITIQQDAQQAQEPDVPAAARSEDEDNLPEEPPFIPFEGEVVIYEEEHPAATALTPEAAAELVNRIEQGDEAELVTPPMPEIDIAATELIAGESALVILRVPFHPNRLYLKVWMTDPQTRSLTDEPRQITHLAPNGRGQLEGSIQLAVPMGCLEAWFEAISVDMVTQQESYKASVSRSINPLGIEDSSRLDEFEL